MEEKILTILTELAVPFNIKGRLFLVKAVALVLEKGRPAMTKEVYPEIAKAFESTASRVERAIRHAITTAFDRAPVSVINKYFGNYSWYNEGKLTNSEFIYGLAEYLRLHK